LRLDLVLAAAAYLSTLVGLFAGWVTPGQMLFLFWLETAILFAFALPQLVARGRPPLLALVLGFFLFGQYEFVLAAARDHADPFVTGAELAARLWLGAAGPALLILAGRVLRRRELDAAGPVPARTPWSGLVPAGAADAVGRIVLMHVAIILGGFALGLFAVGLGQAHALVGLRAAVELGPLMRNLRASTGA